MALTLTEIIADETNFPDGTTLALPNGESKTLGDFRKDYRLKDADYRQKTARVAEERRDLEARDARQQAAYLEAESKLAAWTKELMQANPNASRAEAELELENDPRYTKLKAQMDKQAAELEERFKKLDTLEQTVLGDQRNRLVQAHRQTLAGLKAKDDELVESELVQFAQERGIPRLDDAYFVMNKEKILANTRKQALEEETPKIAERMRAEIQNPVLPVTRILTPSADAPKTMDQAANAALSDPEILGYLRGV